MHIADYKVDDEYMTPGWVWDLLRPHIPHWTRVWDPFPGDGNSAKYMADELHWEVYTDTTFFEEDCKAWAECDIVVTNPPFSRKKEVLTKLKEHNMPFAILLPVETLGNHYLHDLFAETQLQLLCPRGRINFIKDNKPTKAVSFYSVFFCWQLLDKDLELLYLLL